MFFFIGINYSYASTYRGFAIVRIDTLDEAVSKFKHDIGRFPSNEEGLRALIQEPALESNWNGPYLPYKFIPHDPWNNKYRYIFPAKHGTKEFDIYSFGPNGKDDKGLDDDLTNWRKRTTVISGCILFLLISAPVLLILFIGYCVFKRIRK